MWIEVISISVVGWIMIFFGIKLYDDFKLKRLRRGYNKDDDPSVKIEGANPGMGYRGSNKTNTTKPELQDAVEHAKRELLQDRASGSSVADEQPVSTD